MYYLTLVLNFLEIPKAICISTTLNQPAPNMLTRYFQHLPSLWHKVEALINHIVELVLPWFLLLPGIPRTWRINCALVQIFFQATIIASGNFR